MNYAVTQTLRKVPEITVIFWITKLLTTAMGEVFSDFLATSINPYIAVAAGFIAFAASLLLQFRVKKYLPWAYWLTVAMVAVFGTMAADVLHKQLGVTYGASTLFFALAVGVIFSLWYKKEGTLSIHTITTRRREVFYWLTVVTTFALGTAAGDWTAMSLGLGYLASGVVFSLVILIPLLGRYFKFNEVVSFWFAYIITRPLGASFADWLGKATPNGLGWGDGVVSAVLTILLILCVAFMVVNRHEKNLEKGIARP